MRRIVLLAAAGVMVAVPAVHALATPGTGTGTCTPAYSTGSNPYPNPPSPRTSVTVPVTGTEVYAYPPPGTIGTSGGVGVRGSNGYIQAYGLFSGFGSSGAIEGYSTGPGNANGRIYGNSSGPTVCVGAGGMIVHS